MLKKILSYFGSYKKFAIIGPICVLLDVVCEVFIPRVLANIVDIGIPSQDTGYIIRMGVLMVGLSIAAICLGSSNSFISSRASQGLGYNIRKAIFAKVQDFSFANVDKFSTASLVTRTTSDVNAVQMAVMFSLRLMVRAPIMIISSLFMSFNISMELSTILLISLPVLALGVYLIMRKVIPLFQQTQVKLDNLSAVVQENLIGMRVVKAYVREDREIEKFENANLNFMNIAITAVSIVIMIMPFMMFVLNATTLSALWRGGRLVYAGQLSPGNLIGFLTYIFQILMSLILLSMVFMMVGRARASAERIIEVLDEEIDITDSSKALSEGIEVGSGSVEFKDVCFKYSHEAPDNILCNLNFAVKSGEIIALVGSTGSGKSSLVNLIPRLYDATSGSVMVDGRDVRDYTIENLRKSIGVVLQKNVLFAGTIRDNIKWGNENATDDEVIEAAKIAQAHDFIMSFPDGYDSRIEQGGTNVSGGQRQRLCIARAMLKHPKILILDDSTSAVDTDTESKIRKAFYDKAKDTTIFIVAQRISSVKDADKIIVMDDGKITGTGTHEQLIKENRIYQEISRSQNWEVA